MGSNRRRTDILGALWQEISPLNRPKAIAWSAVTSSEAGLIQRCLAGDEEAHAAIGLRTSRLVLGLATHCSAIVKRPLDCRRKCSFGFFGHCTGSRAVGPSHWIFRIVVNQVRNRQRWWRRRARSNQVSSTSTSAITASLVLSENAHSPDRELARKEIGARLELRFRLPFDSGPRWCCAKLKDLLRGNCFLAGSSLRHVKSR